MYSVTTENFMKPSLFSTLIAGVILFAISIHKKKNQPVPVLADTDKRYDIEEFITDEEL